MAVEYAMFMKRYVRHKITSSPNFEVFLPSPSGPMVLLNSKRRPGNKDQPINVFVIIDQFYCITKNSQTGKGSSPMI
jgi:hypothetical protein